MAEQDQKTNSNSKDFIVGTILGGMVGAFTALLLAPKTGEEFRKDLGGQSKDVFQKSADLAKNFSGSSSEVVEKAKEVASNLKNKDKEPYS